MGNKAEGNKGNISSDYSVYLEEDSYVNEDSESANDEADSLSKNTKEELIAAKEENDIPEDFEDISSNEKTSSGNQFMLWWKRRKMWQKVLLIVILIVLIAIIIAGSIIWQKLSLVDTNGEDDYISDEAYDNDINMASMDGITDASSLNDLLMKWSTNGGEKMHSKYVKNVLLIGLRDGLADSMMLVSVNEKTKQITLASFYRDSYTYIQPEKKKNRFAKLNAAYSIGGAKCLVKTIEDDYKIKLDNYVVVDTNSFVKVIDALGGVDVNITEKEANYLNSTWTEWTFTGKQVTFESGMNHLNGEKALMFCRVRKLDSDIGRTERQRRVISSIITRFKNASIDELNSAVNVLLPNVKTSMSKTQIIGFTGDAVTSGWLKFPILQMTMPTTDTSRGGYVGDQWVWIVDYEGAAYQLQTALYGKSNINLTDGRVSAIKLKPTTSNYVTTSQNNIDETIKTEPTKVNNSTTTSTSSYLTTEKTDNQVDTSLTTDTLPNTTVSSIEGEQNSTASNNEND